MKTKSLLFRIGRVVALSLFTLFIPLIGIQYANLRKTAFSDFDREVSVNIQLISLALAKPVYEFSGATIQGLEGRTRRQGVTLLLSSFLRRSTA